MTAPGKIAVITGGNRGLGRATALRLAAGGTGVIITYRSHAQEAAASSATASRPSRTWRARQPWAGSGSPTRGG